MSRATLKLVGDLFNQYDKDGSGYFDKKEFSRILNACGLDEWYVRRLFDVIDANDDNMINYDEFADWLEHGDRSAIKRISMAAKQNKPPSQSQKLSPLENLRARFPRRTDQELQAALDKAGGHGGKALRYLASQPNAGEPQYGHSGGDSALPRRTRVELHDFHPKHALNGKLGTVLGWDESMGRYVIDLDDGSNVRVPAEHVRQYGRR